VGVGLPETDALGGHDPYSASKGCTELVVASYRHAFLAGQGVALATARAGNVIGGGDWTASRLVPDVLAAFAAGEPVPCATPAPSAPGSTCSSPGRLPALAQRLVESGPAWADGWNFGPDDRDAKRRLGRRAPRRRLGPRRPLGPAPTPPRCTRPTPSSSTAARPAPPGLAPRWHAESGGPQPRLASAWRSGADMRRYTLDEIAAFGSHP
jgi:CDP-glucose 4,6-dehydratase